MVEPNPARFIVEMLKIVRSDQGKTNKVGMIEWKSNQFRTALDLHGKGGFTISESLAAASNVLDWLMERTKTFPRRKAERYSLACNQIRRRIDWELSDSQPAEGETRPNLDSLITEFEHFAIELEEETEFLKIDDETIDEWERMVMDLESSIRESGMEQTARSLLLDVMLALKSAIRDLRKFGTVACAERLKDTLGRLGVAQATVPKTADNGGYLKQAWDIFAKIVPYVEVVGKLKALPDLIHALNPPSK